MEIREFMESVAERLVAAGLKKTRDVGCHLYFMTMTH